MPRRLATAPPPRAPISKCSAPPVTPTPWPASARTPARRRSARRPNWWRPIRAANLPSYTFAELGIVTIGQIADFATKDELSALNSRIDKVSGRTDKALAGVAMAFAMSGVPTLLQSETFAMSGNWGTFEGENGLAVNAAVRLAKTCSSMAASLGDSTRTSPAAGWACASAGRPVNSPARRCSYFEQNAPAPVALPTRQSQLQRSGCSPTGRVFPSLLPS